jgi:hypothetical protein
MEPRSSPWQEPGARHPEPLVAWLSWIGSAIANAAMRPDFLLLQIASRDLDVAIIGRLAATNLTLGNEFKRVRLTR